MQHLFQLQKRLPKWRQIFVENSFKKPGYLSKNTKLCIFLILRSMFKFHKHDCGQTRIKYYVGREI